MSYVTLTSNVTEGGNIVLKAGSGTQGAVSVTGTLSYTITWPGFSSSGSLTVTTVSSSDYSILIPIPDNSSVGEGSYKVTGSLTVNGETIAVNQSGSIKENDNASFSVDMSNVSSAYYNITRLPMNSALPTKLKPDFFGHYFGQENPQPRFTIDQLDAYTENTTAVAVTAYQFFTGKIPSLAGLDYLLNPSKNTSSLNSPYYTDFNTENRYINFAANLGLKGEGAAKFAADYGALSVNDAITKAYIEVVGTANPAGIAAIQASVGYFAQIAHERMGAENQDLATKAAAIGYLLREVVKGDVGAYGEALENFFLDLGDGTAQTGVSLVGVYGPGSFIADAVLT